MLISGGTLVTTKSPTTLWEGTTAQYLVGGSLDFGYRTASYSEMFRNQLWVAVVVNKRAGMVSRLPLPVYRRESDGGRTSVKDHPYAQLLRRPNSRMDPFTFWTWTSSTFDIFGETFWLKNRDRGGRPTELIPAHPTKMHLEQDDTWTYRSGTITVEGIGREDVVHFKAYNPDSLDRGLSRLEPLRRTLENEEAARRATSSFWRRGARPGMVLAHPGQISDGAQRRLSQQWDENNGGADNTGKTVILEEGMKPEVLQLTAEEAQYIETRKLNREEVVAAYDMPPPAVHILDHATFSNITEQFRSVYRDTMAPVLGYFEAVLESQVRGSVRNGRREPDFGDDVYAEFLMDEVLRGDFEARADAMQKAINSGQMTPNEARQLENRPAKPGGDGLFINGALVPLVVQSALPIPRSDQRAVMGRLSRVQSLADVDARTLTDGLTSPQPVAEALTAEKEAGGTVATFKTRLRALTEESP